RPVAGLHRGRRPRRRHRAAAAAQPAAGGARRGRPVSAATATGAAARVFQADIPAVLERYELKYTVPLEWVGPISEFIRPYCFMDAYSARCADGFYRVNSLYLDSPDLIFLRTKQCGAAKRFNMRVRTYGDQPGLPYFFEIKHKNGDAIRKVRALIRGEDLAGQDLEGVILGAGRP